MTERPLRVAVVGAGPSGLYAVGHLLEGPGGTYHGGRLIRLSHKRIEVDLFDKLATPWGLVRHGVAPDHPETKLVQTVFEAISSRPGFRFYGTVEVGVDVTPDELRQWYDAVIYAVGASGDVRLGIPGQDLPGCLAAREFVAWYNGHPDYRSLDVDLSHERAVVIGNGNVALDVARILTRQPEELARTDIAEQALSALRASKIREVIVLGRRGPSNAAFSNPELCELADLAGVDIIVDPADLDAVDDNRKAAIVRRYAERPRGGHPRRIALRFHWSPVALLSSDGRVGGVRIVRNPPPDDASVTGSTKNEMSIDCGLVLRSIGYFGISLDGLPFDEQRGVVPSIDGRVRPGTYVTGWIKRGARGIIGTNKKCARDTVRSLLADAEAGVLATVGTAGAADLDARIRARCPRVVDQAGWLRIDDHERKAGRAESRPRAKLTAIEELLAVADGADMETHRYRSSAIDHCATPGRPQ